MRSQSAALTLGTREKIATDAEARSQLLLPQESIAKYRLEIESVVVKDKTVVPYGLQNTGEVLEPVARDIPPGVTGTGGATQALAKDVAIPLKEAWDISVIPPVRVFPPP